MIAIVRALNVKSMRLLVLLLLTISTSSKQFILDAVIDQNISASFIAQVINITIPRFRQSADLAITFEPLENLPYLFFTDQSEGPSLKYAEVVAERKDIFSINTKKLEPGKPLFLSFKTVSSFVEMKSIKINIGYSFDKYLTRGLLLALFCTLLNFYTINAYVILLFLPISYFLIQRDQQIFSCFFISLLHFYLRNKHFNKIILIMYILPYFVLYAPWCYFVAFVFEQINSHQSIL